MALGRYGPITVDQARILVSEKLLDVAKGSDPCKRRDEERTGRTFGQLADDYLQQHAYPRKSVAAASEDERKLRVKPIPLWGRRRVDEIDQSEIVALHNAIRQAISHYTANRYLERT